MSLLSCLELESPDRTCSLDEKTHFDRQFHVPNAFCMPLFNDSYARKCSFLQVVGRRRLEWPDVIAESVRFIPFHSFMVFILFWDELANRNGFEMLLFIMESLISRQHRTKLSVLQAGHARSFQEAPEVARPVPLQSPQGAFRFG